MSNFKTEKTENGFSTFNFFGIVHLAMNSMAGMNFWQKKKKKKKKKKEACFKSYDH